MPEFDITQALAVDSLDGVPDTFKPLYAEANGKFAIPDTHKGVVDFIGNLNKNLNASRAETKVLKGKAVDLTPLADFGATVDEIAAAVKAKIDEQQELIVKGGKPNLDKIKQDLAAGFSAEKTKLETRNTALTGQLYNMLVENAGISAVTELKGVPELLMPLIKARVKVIEEDGKFVVQVVDAAGDVRYSGATGTLMTIKELVAEMKADAKYGRVFESESGSGGGANNGGQNKNQNRNGGQGQTTLHGTSKIAAGLNKRG